MKKLITLLLLVPAFNTFSQDWPVKKQVMAAKAKQVVFKNIPAFSFVANKTLSQRGIYQQLKLNTSLLGELMNQRPDAIRVTLPLGNNKTITCDLVKFSLGNIKFTENNNSVIENVKLPVTYRGIVAGEENKNNVMLTVNEDYLSLTASMSDKVLQVTKADEKDKGTYRLYNSSMVRFPESQAIDCGTNTKTASQTANGIQLTGVRENPLAVEDKCVFVFVDCFYNFYLWRDSSIQQTVNYVYELYNYVTAGYYNESINIQITAINVWSTTDPYRHDSRENARADLVAKWKDNFWGNMCAGLDYTKKGNGGLAGDIGRIKGLTVNTCPAYVPNQNGKDSLSACLYADLNFRGNIKNFPTGPNVTGLQIVVVMHEMGHQLGSYHTHWCGWKLSSNPDVFGAIDSCAATEPTAGGTCPKGPPPGPNGGTIMSYCHLDTLEFINYSNGFGPLPGNAIRNFVDQSACILPCVDCTAFINHNNNNSMYAYHQNEGPVRKNEGGSDGYNNQFIIIPKKIKQ